MENKVENKVENKLENKVENKVENKNPPGSAVSLRGGLASGDSRRRRESFLNVGQQKPQAVFSGLFSVFLLTPLLSPLPFESQAGRLHYVFYL